MDVHKRFLSAMRREAQGYIPFSFSLCPSRLEEFTRRTGLVDRVAYYHFPAGSVWVSCTADPRRFDTWYQNDPSVMICCDFGFDSRKGTMARSGCHWLLARICTIRVEMATRYAQAGCDVLCLVDDVGTQIDMMIAPSRWNEMLKPRLKRVSVWIS